MCPKVGGFRKERCAPNVNLDLEAGGVELNTFESGSDVEASG